MLDANEQMRSMMPHMEPARDASRYAQKYAQEYAERQWALEHAIEAERSFEPIIGLIQRDFREMQQALAAAQLLFTCTDLMLREVWAGPVAPRHIAASASLTVTPTLTAQAEVVKATDSDYVDRQPDARPNAHQPLDYEVLEVRLLLGWALIWPLYRLS
jgi:hypothetical protein